MYSWIFYFVNNGITGIEESSEVFLLYLLCYLVKINENDTGQFHRS